MSMVLQVVVLLVPAPQQAFGTVALGGGILNGQETALAARGAPS